MEKIAYKYDEQTGQYLGTINTFLDNVRSLAEDRKVYILPANSTFTPVQDEIPVNYSARFDPSSNKWDIVEDYSQTLFWDKDTAQLASVEFMQLVPKNLTLHKPFEKQEGLANYFNVATDSWEMVPDLRGKTYYKKSSGEAVAIDKTCPLPDDLTDKEKPDPFHVWSNTKDNWVKDILLENTEKKAILKAEAEEQIKLLERKDKLKRATDSEIAKLYLLYDFTVNLEELDLTDKKLIFPEMPS